MIAPKISALVLAGIMSLTGTAFAQDYPPPMDSISLSLSAEDWVETDEPKVTIGVEAAFQGADAGSVRNEILTALDGISPDADWRFVRFNRSVGSAGLEQFSAAVEARLADSALDGLADKVSDAGRPGFKLNLGAVSFTPTLEDKEAVQGELRARIYEMAGEELDRVNAAYPDRTYRVAMIEFFDGVAPVYAEQRGRMLEAVQAAADSFVGQDGVSVSQRLVLSARLVLEAQVPQ